MKNFKELISNNGSLGAVIVGIYFSVNTLTGKVEKMQSDFQKSLQTMHGQAMVKVDKMTETLNKVVTLTAIQSREIKLGEKRDLDISEAVRENAKMIKDNKESIIRINQTLLK